MGDGITHFHFRTGLDTRYNIAYVTGTDFFTRTHVQFENAYLIGIVLLAGVDEAYQVAAVQGTVHYFEISDDTAERIEDGVEDQTLQRCGRVSFGRRNPLDNSV